MSRKRAGQSPTRAAASTRSTAAPLSAKDRRKFAKYRDDKHALRARVARGAGPAMKALMSLSMEDEQNLCAIPEGYIKLSAMRRSAFREHVRSMKLDPAIIHFVAQLAERFGPKVRVWHNVVDWTVAILIARYGEAPEHWPKSFSADDVRRVDALLAGRTPMFEGVTPLGHVDVEELRRGGAAADVVTKSLLGSPGASPGGSMMLGLDDGEDD